MYPLPISPATLELHVMLGYFKFVNLKFGHNQFGAKLEKLQWFILYECLSNSNPQFTRLSIFYKFYWDFHTRIHQVIKTSPTNFIVVILISIVCLKILIWNDIIILAYYQTFILLHIPVRKYTMRPIQCPLVIAGTSSGCFMKSLGLRNTPTKWVSQFDLLSMMPVWVYM